MSFERAAEMARSIQETAAKRSSSARAVALASEFDDGQLVLWSEGQRGIPNELVRCAVFSAKNRKEPRRTYDPQVPLSIPIIGGGEVLLIGQELRQEDERVWLQLIHLAKEARSEWITFAPHSLIRAIEWPNNGASYTRLLACIRRLSTTGLELYSSRFDKGVSVKLIGKYEYSKDASTPWRVQVFDREDNQMMMLFDKLYSRLDWAMRLSLPEGVATWLHGFFSSHSEPYAHKIETLARGAGIVLDVPEDDESRRKERLRDAKKTIKRALEALVAIGFLTSYSVSTKGLVSVIRKD